MTSMARKLDSGVLDTACRRLKEELGCSDERAFDLLYGWAADCKDKPVYGLAQVVARGNCLEYLRKTHKKH